MAIESYRDLDVWRIAMDLAEMSYRLAKDFPQSELFGLTSQVRRAAASVPANIAEGHGREGRKEFIRALRIAQGSLKELETHLLLAERVALVQPGQLTELLQLIDREGRMLRALIRALVAKGIGKT